MRQFADRVKQVDRMTTEWGFSQVSVWRSHKCVLKKAEDKSEEEDNVQH